MVFASIIKQKKTLLVDSLARKARKDGTSSIMPWRDECSLWTRDFRMRLRFESERIANAGNWNVLVPAGKETNRDAVIIGERKQHKANRICTWKGVGMWCCRTIFRPYLWDLKSSGTRRHRGWQPRKRILGRLGSILSITSWIWGEKLGGNNS